MSDIYVADFAEPVEVTATPTVETSNVVPDDTVKQLGALALYLTSMIAIAYLLLRK